MGLGNGIVLSTIIWAISGLAALGLYLLVSKLPVLTQLFLGV